jgi:uncharacterized membrane protein
LLFKKNGTIRSAIYLDKEIVNTAHRKDYIVNDFIPKIEAFEKKLALIYVSGMPYIRTLNAMSIMNEISLFIGVSLLLTSLIFSFSVPSELH